VVSPFFFLKIKKKLLKFHSIFQALQIYNNLGMLPLIDPSKTDICLLHVYNKSFMEREYARGIIGGIHRNSHSAIVESFPIIGIINY
jgi:hypothetical protein